MAGNCCIGQCNQGAHTGVCANPQRHRHTPLFTRSRPFCSLHGSFFHLPSVLCTPYAYAEPPKFPHSLHTPREPCHSLWGTFFSLFPSCTWRSVHSGPFFLIDTSNETKMFTVGRTYFHLHSCKKTELKKSVNRGKELGLRV